MSRYIDADEAIYATTRAIAKCIPILQGHNAKVSLKVVEAISTLPSIDLADYVPKDFHDKTCEAMAKAHQEEITDMVSVVRCKECKKCYKDTDALTKQTVFICQKHKYEFDWEKVEADDFCSYGEREGE